MRSPWLLSVLLAACAGAPADRVAAPAAAPPPPEAATPPLREVRFVGMCDASGAVALSATLLIAADDEDNVLRAYHAERGGEPLAGSDMSAALDLPLKGKKQPRHPEMDLEAATLLGGYAFWITSHGRNKKGRLKEERVQFFATTVAADGRDLALVGSYAALLDDLAADPRYAGFGLEAAAELPPKAPGGLNIEGLTATPEGTLLIGFRNPVPGGRALIAPLENPLEVLDGAAPARFGDPVQLDLGGQGVRSLSWWRGRYLIIGGAVDEGGVSRLYTWDGRGMPAAAPVELAGYNPEGFFSPEDRDEILLLSDDGSRELDGVPCKELEDPARRSFRGVWVRLE